MPTARNWSQGLRVENRGNRCASVWILASGQVPTLSVDGESLEQALLDAGHARPYRGSRR